MWCNRNQNYGEIGEGEAANSSAGPLEEGMMQSGLRRANSTPSATVEPMNRSVKNPSIKLRPDILDPEYAAGDAEVITKANIICCSFIDG